MNSEKPESRDSGRFRPGQSGNPSGRPKSYNAALRERLEREGEKVAEAVIKRALEGDMGAARLILERISPPLKAMAAPSLIEIPEPYTPLSAATAIIHAAATGQLAPDIAAQLVAATAQLCRIEEVEQLRDRLDALEKSLTTIPIE